ncbi:membrane protein of ER body 1-like [Cynara cardunculus var. scolymus]|uniref:membrane protein of ER body 1-like n=1 Tax=Cynara cardunculus var. scolymus TaxID=59895 RepID=UPI000D625E62|nr:membrane protein of ER body 1-like [Cynara cardunculus var. scolymus]
MAGNCGGATTTTTPLLPDVAALEKNSGGERPKEPWKGELVKSIVYAGLDAIITSFSLISSISAGRLSSVDVLVLGFANLVADGISMGFGDYVSSNTERDVAAKERMVTKWEVTNRRRSQEQSLLQRYQALGMNTQDATMVVNIFAKYGDIMVDEKMVQNGILSPDDGEKPWKKGLITFGAFLVFGSFPILAFIILIPFTRNDTHKFIGACILSALALAILGIAKAKIAGQNYWVSVGGTLFNGALAGFAAYGIGWLLRDVAGLED